MLPWCTLSVPVYPVPYCPTETRSGRSHPGILRVEDAAGDGMVTAKEGFFPDSRSSALSSGVLPHVICGAGPGAPARARGL